MKTATIALLLICTAAFAQQKGTFTDSRDKKKYQTVSIGGLTWMAENLSYNAKGSTCTAEKDDGIDCVKDIKKSNVIEKCFNIECTKFGQESCIEYRNLTAKEIQEKNKKIQAECAETGRQYDWAMAKTACPAGWHLPNEEEWDILKDEGAISISEFSWGAIEADKNSARCYSSKSSAVCQYMGSSNFIRCVQGKSPEEALKPIKAPILNAVGKQFNPKINYGSMTDARDKITYKTVKIGEQTWMAENLNYNAEGSKCYKDKDHYCKRDGRLYNPSMARKACPAGWHLPTDEEWSVLGSFAGGKAGAKLKAASGWTDPDTKKAINGTDEFGFSALPAVKEGAWWWSATEKSGNIIYRRITLSEKGSDEIIRSQIRISTVDYYSVRCLEGDTPAAPPAQAPAAAPAQAPAAAGNPSKPMYCVSSVMNNPVSCLELTDTPADKSVCDTQNNSMKMMMGKAEWTANKPTVKCDKVPKK